MHRSLSLAILLLVGATAIGQEANLIVPEVLRSRVVHAAADAVRQNYIFPEVAERAAVAIEEAIASGSYGEYQDPQAFAERVTSDLREATDDLHIRLAAPQPAVANNAAPPRVRLENEAGVVRSDLLEGNIGYIEVVAFPGLEAFRPALDRAMVGLGATRALIIDARRHGGGGADAEAYFVSYFINEVEPVPINRFIGRISGTQTFSSRTFFSYETPYYYGDDKQVFVLISSRTFSGGEALAYDMRALGLAVLVGETTAGGGNPGRFFAVGEGFSVFVPTGRGENPTTGGNWDGIGVKPDIPAPSADALRIVLAELGLSTEQVEIGNLSLRRLFHPEHNE